MKYQVKKIPGYKNKMKFLTKTIDQARERNRRYEKACLEVTRLKEVVEELTHTNNRLLLALESAEVGFIDVDLITNNIIASHRIYEIYGFDYSEPISYQKVINTIYHEDKDRVIEQITSSFSKKDELVQVDFRVVNTKRGLLWIRGTAKIIFDQTGKPINMIVSHIDLTLQKNQEKKLLDTEKEKSYVLENAVEEKDRFLSLVSHELKTPIAVINSAIQTMEFICKDELSNKAKAYLDTILRNNNRQLRLVNNLLDVTNIKSSQLRINKRNIDIVYLTRTIAESIAAFAEQKKIALSFSSTIEEENIEIDELKYEQTLLNLLSNAVKFTPEGKSVAVKLSQLIDKGKRMICIQVIDTGIGIPSDKKEFIFERFGQVDSSLSKQKEGIGIGLYLVKKLVEAQGGEILLESVEGEGTTFTILFPSTRSIQNSDEQMTWIIPNGRLVKAATIELSDIY